MRIGELARKAGVGVETVRYYQRIGLMPQPPRPLSGFRRYEAADLQRLRFIVRAKQLGFSLDEITGLLALSSRDCADVQALARHKLQTVRNRIDDLQRMAGVLEGVVRQCAERQPHEGCPIIESLDAE